MAECSGQNRKLMPMTPDISVIIPVYKCASTLKELCDGIESAIGETGATYEIILVNDGSPSNDWEEIKALAKQNPVIKGILFDANFGQHNAIACGISHAKAFYVVVMDGDMQDNPAFIPDLFSKIKEGYDVVYARRSRDRHCMMKRLSNFVFKKVMWYIMGVRINPDIANYCIIRKSLIEDIKVFSIASIKFLPSLSAFYGVKHTTVDVIHGCRKSGVSGYDFPKRFKLGIEIVNAFAGMRLEFFFKALLLTMLIILTGAITAIYIKPMSVYSLLFVVFVMGGAATLMFLSAIVVNNIKNLKRNKGRAFYRIAEVVNIPDEDVQKEIS